MEKKFLSELEDLQLVEIIAIGKMLKVEEVEDFEEFITNIIVEFSKQNRNTKKEMLALVKDVSKVNRRSKNN